MDFIKVYTLLPAPAFRAVMAEASRRGLRVSGHVPADISPVEAAEAGMQSIEHMRAELGGYCTRATEAACAPAIAAFRAHGTWQVPTLAVRRARAYLDEPTRATDPRLADEPRALRERGWTHADDALAQKDEADFRTMRGEFDDEQWLAGHLHRSGVRLLAGSDAGADFSLPRLRSARRTAPNWSRRDSRRSRPCRRPRSGPPRSSADRAVPGKSRAGADADLVLLDDNPLADIGAVSRIRGVMTRGAWLPRADLDRMLTPAAREARCRMHHHVRARDAVVVKCEM